MTYLRIAAVSLTILFAVTLVWLYGVKTTLIWAAAMSAFILLLYLATVPLRRRQRRIFAELGLDRHGRPLPEEEEEDEPGGSASAAVNGGAEHGRAGEERTGEDRDA